MKQTRNIFLIKGQANDVQKALENLRFKGVKAIVSENVSEEEIADVFKCNKSVLCVGKIPATIEAKTTVIIVGSDENKGECIPNSYFLNVGKDNIVEQFQAIAKELNMDIGDHQSNSSGLKGQQQISDCRYCQFIRKGINKHHQKIVYKSDNFIVMPTLGQFIKGYLLIIPYHHTTSLANATKREREEFQYVLNDVKDILEITYGVRRTLVWENGTGNNGIGKAKNSDVHAHIHVAPSFWTAKDIEQANVFDFTKIKFDELPKYRNQSYLLVEDVNNKWIINNDPEVYIPRQYVRQIVAEEYGIRDEQWNWREYPFYELMEETVVDIVYALKSNWETLPTRIRKNTKDFLD